MAMLTTEGKSQIFFMYMRRMKKKYLNYMQHKCHEVCVCMCVFMFVCVCVCTVLVCLLRGSQFSAN